MIKGNEMQIVIKHTKTIDEYKKLRDKLEKLSEKCSKNHIDHVSNWAHGKPKKVWLSTDTKENNSLDGVVICIDYEYGSWWHYNETGEWW